MNDTPAIADVISDQDLLVAIAAAGAMVAFANASHAERKTLLQAAKAILSFGQEPRE